MRFLNYFTAVFRKDPREMASLNAFRAIAILMLFYVHLTGGLQAKLAEMPWFIRNFLYNGSSSIDMFFALSGFLISGQLMRELAKSNSIDFKKFYLKRTLRIFPPYYIFLGFQTLLIIAAMSKHPEHADKLAAARDRVIYDALYVTNYIPGTIIHGWSLALEEQFYLAFPLVLFALFRFLPQKHWLSALVGLYLIPLAYRFVIHSVVVSPADPAVVKELYIKWIYYPTQGHIDSIFAGAIAAYVFDFRKDWWRWLTENTVRRRMILAGSFLVFFLMSTLVYEYESGILNQVLRFNVYNLLWGLLMLVTAREGTLSNRVLSWGFWAPIARLSYCAYLIHIFAIGVIARKLFMKPVITYVDILIWWLPVAFGVMVYAYFFHIIGEKPFLMLRDWIISRQKEKQSAINLAGK